MTDEEAKKIGGNKYYEFKDGVISKETRKQIFGIDSYIKKGEPEKEVLPDVTKPVIETYEDQEPVRLNDVEDSVNTLPPWMRGKHLETTPEVGGLEMDTFKRPAKEIQIKANFGEEVSEDIQLQTKPKYVEP